MKHFLPWFRLTPLKMAKRSSIQSLNPIKKTARLPSQHKAQTILCSEHILLLSWRQNYKSVIIVNTKRRSLSVKRLINKFSCAVNRKRSITFEFIFSEKMRNKEVKMTSDNVMRIDSCYFWHEIWYNDFIYRKLMFRVIYFIRFCCCLFLMGSSCLSFEELSSVSREMS